VYTLFVPPPPSTLASGKNLFHPFILWFCWRENIGDNKKDIAVLLVEIRTALQRDSEHCFHAQVCYTQIDSSLPDLFTTSQSPSHSDLCHFKITLFTPLQWAHQTLSSFGFPTFPYPSCMCSPLSVWPVSNNITACVLGLKSAYEGEHMIFGLLGQANLTQNDVLQFHPFTSEW
jgi:hypothetical protein